MDNISLDTLAEMLVNAEMNKDRYSRIMLENEKQETIKEVVEFQHSLELLEHYINFGLAVLQAMDSRIAQN